MPVRLVDRMQQNYQSSEKKRRESQQTLKVHYLSGKENTRLNILIKIWQWHVNADFICSICAYGMQRIVQLDVT